MLRLIVTICLISSTLSAVRPEQIFNKHLEFSFLFALNPPLYEIELKIRKLTDHLIMIEHALAFYQDNKTIDMLMDMHEKTLNSLNKHQRFYAKIKSYSR